MSSKRTVSTFTVLSVILLVYFACVFQHIELLGFYMDATNPDYLVAHCLSPALNNLGASSKSGAIHIADARSIESIGLSFVVPVFNESETGFDAGKIEPVKIAPRSTSWSLFLKELYLSAGFST